MDPQLTAGFRSLLESYAGRVAVVQSELLALYRRKRVALVTADLPTLRPLNEGEAELGDRLRTLVTERSAVLAQAQRFGLPHGSLVEVAVGVGCPPTVLDEIAACRRRAEALRREGWVQWVVARRSLAQTSELLELIGRAGRGPAPTYAERSGRASAAGGSLLDASA